MTRSAEAYSPTTPNLTQKRILIYWLPLAASWLLMATEGPFVNGALARMFDGELMIAAFGIVVSLSITIESPVISLLPTSTALSRNRQSYIQIRRFTLHLMLGTTILHVLMGWTVLFDIIVDDIMGIPENLLEPIRLGMRYMLFWSAAIAWRRFKQGVLIRHGKTRFVGQGTVVRLISMAATVILLSGVGQFPGVVIGTIALSTGVIAEALYSQWAASSIVTERFNQDDQKDNESELKYLDLVKFHWPLAAGMLLFLLVQPIIGAALARSPNPESALAAWPVLSSLLFFVRSPTVALPEAIIALSEEPNSLKPLQTFSSRVGWVCVLLLGFVCFTPFSQFYFRTLIGLSQELTDLAVFGGRLGIFIPIITSGVFFFRGILTSKKATFSLTKAMIINLVSMIIILYLGVTFKAPGVSLAVIALSIAWLLETFSLANSFRKINVIPA